MKNRRFMGFVAAITASAMLSGVHTFGTNDPYNDKTFKTYENLGEDSAIPSLFKNDDVFSNYKDYPPVISDGVEYVPLELFYGLSNYKINYSDDNTNFYIQNKKTNDYISFSINDNYAVTDKNKVYETNVPTYYGVHYVPLRTVCDTVGIGCSTYNDGENKVYAIEIYTDDQSLSAKELLEIHAPDLYSSNEESAVTQEQTAVPETSTVPSQQPEYSYSPNQGNYSTSEGYYPQNGNYSQNYGYGNGTTQTNTVTETTEKKEEVKTETPSEPKAPEYKKGTVMFFYTPELFENAGKTLDALDELGITAVFFVTKDNILDNPGVIRRIYTSGHTLGIALTDDDGELFSENVLEERINAAEDALYEVAKIKTRLLYISESADKKTAASKEVTARIEKLGLYTVELNADAETETLSTKKAAEKMRTSLLDIRRNFGSTTAYFRMQHTDSAISALGAAYSVSSANPVVRIDAFDETRKG